MCGSPSTIVDNPSNGVHDRQAAIEADPSFADAFSNMGNVFKALGQYDEAISCVSTAMQLQPGYADAYVVLAVAALRVAPVLTTRVCVFLLPGVATWHPCTRTLVTS